MTSQDYTDEETATDICPASRDGGAAGRPAAGADPQKRDQILDGAKKVFMQKGFDAASMNDITREAGVSKGTIYVYFQNKEELFAALIETERARIVASARHALDEDEPLREALVDFGVALVTGITSDYTIQAMRTVIGVIDRMPGLAVRFFAAGPESGLCVLKAYLDRNVASGKLSIEDTGFAAQQFLSLCTAGLLKHRLFGVLATPPRNEDVERTVISATDLFLAFYGSKR